MERIAAEPARRFEITGGLQEGYAGGATHQLADVVAAHHAWQQERGVVLGCMIVPATVSYGWPEGGTIACACEPGFILSGLVNVEHMAQTYDGLIEMYLDELAEALAERLGQSRIYVSYLGVAWILQRDGARMPAEEAPHGH